MSDLTREQLQMQGVDPLHGRHFLVCKRDGRVEEFNEARIFLALESAFKAQQGFAPEQALPDGLQGDVKRCADRVVDRVLGRAVRGEQLEVERIQDAAEEQLMVDGYHEVARRYILYREDRRRTRAEREARVKLPPSPEEMRVAPLPPVGGREADMERSDRALAQKRLGAIYEQALPKSLAGGTLEEPHRRQFDSYLNEGGCLRCVDPELLEFDLKRLARCLRLERDALFTAGGIEALAKRYLASEDGLCIETPQYFWMKVAMGLALAEKGGKEERAQEFYEALSSFRFIASDAILRHAGTLRRQWIARNEEEGAPCTWLELWCRDIWEFLARAGVGRQNKGLWVPDLFMQRVREHGPWTLFDPAETEDLLCAGGGDFESCYLACEQVAAQGGLGFSRRVNARDLWREILTSLQLTGQPWLRFKDAVHIRSPQEHCGLLGGEFDEAGLACPLGGINLAAHLREGALDVTLLQNTVTSAVRMLDNAVDLSASVAGLKHRPIGLGVAGFAEALGRLGLRADSMAAADFADGSMELVSYFAILASAQLAEERGRFSSYDDSKWSRGILPADSLALLSKKRVSPLNVRGAAKQDWESVRARVREQGMRNGATTAVTPLRGPCAVAALSPATGAGDAYWLMECAARRQKWLDLEHTLDLPLPEKDLGRLSHFYMEAWEKGLKTTRQLILIPRARSKETVEARPRSEPALARV